MKSIIKRFHLGQKGFTLIELLVVIAIQAYATELAIVQTNVVAYMANNNGAIPANTDALASYFVSPLATGHTYTIDQTTGKVTCTAYPGVIP
jgi:hypothetical protein